MSTRVKNELNAELKCLSKIYIIKRTLNMKDEKFYNLNEIALSFSMTGVIPLS